MTLTGLLLTLIPLALLLAVVAMLRRRGLGMPLGRWLAWLAACSLSGALLLAIVRAGGLSGADWGEAALLALGAFAVELLATALIYARARPGA